MVYVGSRLPFFALTTPGRVPSIVLRPAGQCENACNQQTSDKDEHQDQVVSLTSCGFKNSKGNIDEGKQKRSNGDTDRARERAAASGNALVKKKPADHSLEQPL